LFWYTFCMEEKLKKYLQRSNFENVSEVSDITALVDDDSSNHLNYKVTTPKGTYVVRITKPGSLLSYANLSDEYTILKLVEKYSIGPRVYHIDLENFESPLLVEEFIDGISYNSFQIATEEMFDGAIELLVTTSNIGTGFDEFPFKFTYTTYETNFKAWSVRLEEVEKSLGNKHVIMNEFKSIATSARDILKKNDSFLRDSSKEFIYNDVHGGNMFWLQKENKAKFIDWQKVSLGDPVFMIALFARRFGHMWKMKNQEFADKVLKSYAHKKNINNLEELFRARMLERSVSDMIWSVWAYIKRSVPINITSIDENKYYREAKQLISEI
jgi:aminoglycoside phosphotransferase (APT) family kinase protein